MRAGGLDLLLYNLGDDAGRARFFDAVPLRKRVDAVLVLCLPLTPREIEVLQALNVPVVVVSRHTTGRRPRSAPDLAGRDFTAPAPDRVCTADITYVPT